MHIDLPLISGLVMSIIHVISGPDHLAAVTPLAIDSKKKSWGIGFAWGTGHILGMVILGFFFILLKEYININLISQYGEKLVGFLLITVGIWALSKVKKNHGDEHSHIHPHTHKGEVHIHSHDHEEESKHSHRHKKQHRQNLASALGIGVFHGIAGVSHIIAIIPTLGFKNTTSSALYLGGFCIGTITAMIAYASTLGIISQRSESGNNRKLSIFLRIFGGILAIGVGIFWIIKNFL